MSKQTKWIVATLAAMAMATPALALADHQVGGYYRVQGITDTANGAPGKDKTAESQIDQRFRFKWTNTLNENVKTVYYGEVDTPWGQNSKGFSATDSGGDKVSASVGGGGKVGADGVNMETKNVYLEVKLPDAGVTATLGIQGIGDNTDGVLFNDDMAALKVAGKLGMLDTTVFYSKWDEGAKTNVDDQDLYGLQLKTKAGAATVGADLYWFDNNTKVGQDNIYTLALNGAGKVGEVGLSGWFMYQLGSKGAPGEDLAAYAATVRATVKLGPADTAFRLMYFSDDTDATEDNSINGGGGAFEFYQDNLQIFLADIYYNNTSGGRHALTDAAYAGYGLIGATFSGSLKLDQAMYTKWGVGYFMATDDTGKQGSDLGLEVSAQAGKIIAEKVDVSLRGSYALLGSFYDAAAGGSDPDNMYKLALMVNVPY